MKSSTPPISERVYVETESGATEVLQLRRHRQYPERFMTMFSGTFQMLAGKERPACYFRTLCAALVIFDPVQSRRISIVEICRACPGLTPRSAQRGMALLQADRVILSTGAGAAKAYRLNNRLLSTQSAEKWNALQSDPRIIDGAKLSLLK